MYDFYYNVLQSKYGDKIKLLFTDTDSLCVEIQTEDVYKDMHDMKEHYDFSEYPKNHFCYNTENQAVVGKFKDEFKGKIVTEFVGLRSKLYSLTIDTDVDKDKEKKVCKGCKKCVITNELKFSDYKNTLTNKTKLYKEMNFIKSDLHNVNTVNIEKIVMSCFDNKRHILDDGITSYAFGHYNTNK